MKLLKRLFKFIVILILALCAGVTVCAFNPDLTKALAEKVEELHLGESSEKAEDSLGNEQGSESNIDSSENSAGNSQNQTQDAVGSGQASSDNGTQSLPDVEEYVAPSEEDIRVPGAVGDRLGYEPVSDNGQQIGEAEATDLQKQLETGNTGADYDFDAVKYPYYAMLGSDMQKLYRQIYGNALELVTSFAPVIEISTEDVKTVFEAVYNDHPELFWLETGYSCQYLKNGRCVEITLQYNRTANKLESAKEQFEAEANAILKNAKTLASNYEKEKYVHDALLTNTEYDMGAGMNQSAYSALVNKESVCAGYARAYQYLLQQLGIPCYYCTGYSGGDHAWNIVQLEDGYYNVDVTWDDTTPATYDYFNKSDADYASTHMREGLSRYLPACVGQKYRNLESGEPQQITVNPQTDGGAEGEEVEGELVAGDTENLPDDNSLVSQGYVNENPQKPLSWESNRNQTDPDGTKEESAYGLEDYYTDCLKQMVSVGAGEKQFTNTIPQALWSAIERAYSDGSYKKGYVDEALKELGMSNFAIQLQVQRIDGNYYKLYHNIYTW